MMQAPASAGLALVPMAASDVDEVHALECSVFPHPWSRANFTDSLAAGYDAWLLRDPSGKLAGYFLLMYALDEAHLLDVAVAGERQGTGLGRHLIETLCERARWARNRSCSKCARRTSARWTSTSASALPRSAAARAIIPPMRASARMPS